MHERKKYMGIPIEHEGFDNPYFRIAVPTIKFYEKVVRNTQVESLGEIPKEGPVFMVANHSAAESVIILPYAVATASGRPTRIVVRDTLLDPSIEEDPIVLERTGKKEDMLNNKSTNTMNFPRKLMTNFIQHGGNAIPVHRGSSRSEFFNSVQEAFDDGTIVSMFLQETRTPENDLSNALPGAAFIMKKNPDIPVCLMAMSNVAIDRHDRSTWRRPQVTITQPVTYNQMSPDGSMKVSDIHERFVNTMAELLTHQGIQDIKK